MSVFLKLADPTGPGEGKKTAYSHDQGGAHAVYITRLAATKGDRAALLFHNLPAYLLGESYKETQSNLEAYCRQRCEDELRAPRRGGTGVTRTHYRLTISFPGKIETAKARPLIEKFLVETLPEARGFAAVHQNTKHTHAHVWIDARTLNGKKLDLDYRRFRSLDVRWGAVYASAFGLEHLKEHEEKKSQTRQWKMAHRLGEDQPKPERKDRQFNSIEVKTSVGHEYGKPNEARVGGDQRRVAVEDPRVGAREQGRTRGEQEIDRFTGESQRTLESAKGALREAEALRDRTQERGGLER